MKIKKIILNNIRSYNNQEIFFPEGSTLLSGDIGSGKTSILLAIEFGLFGLQPGQRGSALLRNGAESGGVILELEVDGEIFTIERTLKRGSKSISQDFCTISSNNDRKEISVMELKSRILDILNYPKEFSKKQNLLYKFTVYTPQEEMKQIILQDSETRINTLRHVFGIDKYKKILENTSVIASKIREEKRISEGMVSTLEQDRLTLAEKENELENKHYNLSSLEKELFLKAEAKKKIQDEMESLYERLDEKRKIEQEIEKNKIILSGKNESFSNNSEIINQLNLQLNELNNLNFDEVEIQEAEKQLKIKKHEKDEINENNIKIISKINSLNLKIKESESLTEKIKHLENCPTCLQEVDISHKRNILEKTNNEINESKEGIEFMENERKKVAEKLSGLNEEMSFLEKRIQDLNIIKVKMQGLQEKQQRMEELRKSNILLENEILSIKNEIESKENFVSGFREIEDLFKTKKEQFDEAVKDERLTEIKVAELRKETEFFSKQIEDLKEKIKNLENISHKIKYLAELENWISGKFNPLISFIEKNVMLKLKSEFSKFFSEWFSMLVSDNFNVRLDDDFTPIIEQQDYEIDYAYLSGGERTAIALAYRLALNQVINSLLSRIKTKDVVVLDEPTDGFSDQQLDKMRDVLLQLNVKQLIIVSHEQKIESFVDNVIKFRKVDGLSVMENE